MGGGRTRDPREVLSRSNTGDDIVWGRGVSVAGANGTEDTGTLCGVPETGGKVEGKKAVGWFVAEGGGVKSTSWSGYTTTPYLLGKEVGDSGGMGGLTANIRCMRKIDGLQRRGEAPGAMVETGSSK